MTTVRRWRGEEREHYVERDTGRRFFLYRTLEGEYAVDKWVCAPQYLERAATVSTREEALQELARHGCVDVRSEGEELTCISVDRHASIDSLRRIVRHGSNAALNAIIELSHREAEAKLALGDLLHFILDDLGIGTHDYDDAVGEAIGTVAKIAPDDEKVVATLKRVATAREPNFSGSGIVIQIRRRAWYELKRLGKGEGIGFP